MEVAGSNPVAPANEILNFSGSLFFSGGSFASDIDVALLELVGLGSAGSAGAWGGRGN